MELSDIDIVLAVARSGKISQAMKELNYANPMSLHASKNWSRNIKSSCSTDFPKVLC
ncbi:hypothetical protein Q0F98_19085 [Paenibacillus amylolyticus]|nr:hypothetical protein Q0F98_19085 [Paenibacillus amylolyticus]